MAFPLLLLAAQAAGIGANIYSNRKEQKHLRQSERILGDYESTLGPYEQALERNNQQALTIAREGYGIAEETYKNIESAYGLEKSLVNTRMEQEGLAYTEASLANSEELREVLASQRAIVSARGQSGQGSARAIQDASLHGYGESERARAVSQNFRNLMLKGQAALYDVKSKANQLNRAANINNVTANINQLEAGGLHTKAEFAKTRSGIAQNKGELKLAKSKSNASLFSNIMGQIPFSEMSGIFLNDTGSLTPKGNSPGYKAGVGLTDSQRARLLRRL